MSEVSHTSNDVSEQASSAVPSGICSIPSTNAPVEEISSDEEEDMYISIPTPLGDEHADIFSIVSTLCYGSHNCVDMLELCGGEGDISTLASSRGGVIYGKPR